MDRYYTLRVFPTSRYVRWCGKRVVQDCFSAGRRQRRPALAETPFDMAGLSVRSLTSLFYGFARTGSHLLSKDFLLGYSGEPLRIEK